MIYRRQPLPLLSACSSSPSSYVHCPNLNFCFAYMDNILVSSRSLEHMLHLWALFSQLQQYRILSNPVKCVFRSSKVCRLTTLPLPGQTVWNSVLSDNCRTSHSQWTHVMLPPDTESYHHFATWTSRGQRCFPCFSSESARRSRRTCRCQYLNLYTVSY